MAISLGRVMLQVRKARKAKKELAIDIFGQRCLCCRIDKRTKISPGKCRQHEIRSVLSAESNGAGAVLRHSVAAKQFALKDKSRDHDVVSTAGRQ